MTIDLDAMAINKSKFMADGHKYFELYRKHIPGNISGNILLLSIGNLDCISKIMSMNPNAKYLIIDRKTIIKSLSIVCKDIYDIEAIENDDEDLYNIIQELDMKFDCIVMNPPYQKNLHLKILAEAIKHLKDDNSVCVNLSPDTWLYTFADVNKRSDYNKFSNLPFKEIYRLGLLNKYFDLGHTTYTGAIYVCSKNEKSYNIENELYSDIILANNKIMPKTLNKKIKDVLVNFISKYSSLEENIKTGCPDINTKWTRYMPRLVGNPGDRCSCLASIGSERWDKNFYKGVFNGKTYSETKKKLSNVKNYSDFDYVEFDTENKANNWRDSNNTFFMRYVCTLVHVDSHRHAQWMPWLGDAINPRTGLKGYEGEWTDEDLYKFFNITPDEQKIIEETMAKYK